ncbi:MAG: glycosyl hydrolase family 98, partial [Prevotella sp.]|nr:glycosyl hydrolase family 98 [Prevotella sp.]
ISVKVNGTNQNVRCERTTTNEWRWVFVEASLNEGKNDLVITNTGALPMYIDQVSYRPADVAPMKYAVAIREAAGGTITSNMAEAAEGDTVTLSVNADQGFRLAQLRVVNSVFYTLEKTISFTAGANEITFVMPGDNVTLQPTFADATSVYKLDFSGVDTGTLPPGWRCVQENNDVHEYPNSFGSGARTFNGFAGYQGKALYWREQSAEYGRQSAFPLTLEPGSYTLTYAMAAWKLSPKFKVQLLDAATGSSVATSQVFTATPNANGNTSANLRSAVERTLAINITKKGKYVISFTNESNSSGFDEYLLLECRLNSDPSTGIQLVDADGTQTTTIYDASGRMRQTIGHGLNIIRSANGKTRKVIDRKR